ncbi:MAG: OmpA family protein [Elusimicrobia bacterium]|nr:OmpA family protein [Elusimicrobiota bacterium]
MRRKLISILPLAAVLALTGCPPKNKLPIETKPKAEATPTPTDENANQETNANPNDIQINQEWTEIPALETVHFGFDAANIDDAARTSLKKNVAVIKKLPPSVKVRVEGYADERGTVEYNIALGQRRANAVRTYYVTAGIPKTRVETISFGLERPVCTTHTEECWAMNRRGVTKVRNASAITVNPAMLKE